MARLNSLSLLRDDGVTPELLQELYGNVINGFEAKAVSVLFKNRDLSGDFAAGTVEAKRFVNSASTAYGTARAAGAGVALEVEPVTIAKTVSRELVCEVEEKDLNEYGIRNLLGIKQRAHIASMARELDVAFFREGYATGAQFVPVGATWLKKLEEIVVAMETTKNSFVHGVDREMIGLVVTPAVYSAVRQELAPLPTSENSWVRGDISMLNDVRIVKSVNLPSGALQVVDVMCMVDGAIAQPVHAVPFDIEKIPLSKAYVAELFYDYGTKAVMPDLIKYIGNLFVA